MTLDEIAKLAGVSRTTASYVINGKAKTYRISDKTEKRVMAVVKEHNFRPDHAASALRAGSSRSFGLIIPDLENSSYAKLAKRLESHARQANYQLIISCSDDDADTEMKVAQNLIGRKIDVLYVASSLPSDSNFYRLIQDKGTPVIAIDRGMDDEYFACVISEDLDAAYELTQSLLLKKPQSIGLIGAMPELNISAEREAGFLSAVKEHNLLPILSYGEHFSREHGREVMQAWVNSKQCPEAIITTSYTLLEGVLDVLLDNQSLMKTIKLGTFGDNRLLDFLPIKVNSLPQQFDKITDSALEIGLNAAAKRYQAGVEVIARELITR